MIAVNFPSFLLSTVWFEHFTIFFQGWSSKMRHKKLKTFNSTVWGILRNALMCCCGGMWNGTAALENSSAVAYNVKWKFNMRLLYFISKNLPKRKENTCAPKELYVNFHLSKIIIPLKWKQFTCSWVSEGKNKMVCITQWCTSQQ